MYFTINFFPHTIQQQIALLSISFQGRLKGVRVRSLVPWIFHRGLFNSDVISGDFHVIPYRNISGSIVLKSVQSYFTSSKTARDLCATGFWHTRPRRVFVCAFYTNVTGTRLLLATCLRRRYINSRENNSRTVRGTYGVFTNCPIQVQYQ